MNSELQSIVDFVQSVGLAASTGAFAALSVAFYGLVRVFRLPIIQGRLPARARWDALPKPVTVGLVLGLPVIAAVCGALAAGAAPASVVSAGVAALIAALSAGGVDGAVGALAYRPTPPAILPEARALSDALGAGKPKDPMEERNP